MTWLSKSDITLNVARKLPESDYYGGDWRCCFYKVCLKRKALRAKRETERGFVVYLWLLGLAFLVMEIKKKFIYQLYFILIHLSVSITRGEWGSVGGLGKWDKHLLLLSRRKVNNDEHNHFSRFFSFVLCFFCISDLDPTTTVLLLL